MLTTGIGKTLSYGLALITLPSGGNGPISVGELFMARSGVWQQS